MFQTIFCWLCVPVAVAAASSPTAGPPATDQKVAVLNLATPGLEAEAGRALAANLVTIIASEVAGLGYEVISSADISAMLSFENQKDLVGCEDDISCLAEIGGALGSDLLVAGSLGRLGTDFNLSLTLIDITRAKVLNRFQGMAGSEAVLAGTVHRGVQELFGSGQTRGGLGTLLVKTEPPGANG